MRKKNLAAQPLEAAKGKSPYKLPSNALVIDKPDKKAPVTVEEQKQALKKFISDP